MKEGAGDGSAGLSALNRPRAGHLQLQFRTDGPSHPGGVQGLLVSAPREAHRSGRRGAGRRPAVGRSPRSLGTAGSGSPCGSSQTKPAPGDSRGPANAVSLGHHPPGHRPAHRPAGVRRPQEPASSSPGLRAVVPRTHCPPIFPAVTLAAGPRRAGPSPEASASPGRFRRSGSQPGKGVRAEGGRSGARGTDR